MDQEERIALFLDYENLALGARDNLGGMAFDLRPVADALAERGRVVVRRAYADWSYFDEDRRMLTRSHVELIDMPQRMGASRKNAADIKMAVDALELAFERDYISTFVICTGDSDFTPLVHKLRELNKRVIGVGVEKSTSALLPPACDEFLYYDRLEGVEIPPARACGAAARRGVRPSRCRSSRSRSRSRRLGGPRATSTRSRSSSPRPSPGCSAAPAARSPRRRSSAPCCARTRRSTSPTTGSAPSASCCGTSPSATWSSWPRARPRATPRSPCPSTATGRRRSACCAPWSPTWPAAAAPVALSGLKNQLRRVRPDFSEKKLGYRSFLQFCKAAATSGAVDLEWSPEADDYLLSITPPG